MTADRSPQENAMGTGTALSTMALIFAGLTLLFALFSLFLSNRMSSLHSKSIRAQKESMATETTAIEKMKSAVKNTQQDLQKEKADSEKLSKKLDAAMQELKTLKVQLAKAHKTIEDLRAKAASAASPPPTASQPAASGPMPKSSDSAVTMDGKPAAQPLKENVSPEPERSQGSIEETNIEVDSMKAGGQSPANDPQPATEASEPAATE